MQVCCSGEVAIAELEAKAKEIRREILEMGIRAGSGHLAPALSSADIVAALYFRIMKINPKNPKDEDRDRFILSAGHKCAVQYAALALAGYFPKDVLNTFLQYKSILSGHPDSLKTPGVEISTGSLGHGLPVGVGMALAGKIRKKPYRVFVLLGDGEVSEGSNWEAASHASHYRLDNLVAIIDRNRLCADGVTDEVMNIEPLAERWAKFGWAVREIDGHNMRQIVDALGSVPFESGKPSMVIANTIKGKGISFMENRVDWHHKVPNAEQAEIARKELS